MPPERPPTSPNVLPSLSALVSDRGRYDCDNQKNSSECVLTVFGNKRHYEHQYDAHDHHNQAAISSGVEFVLSSLLMVCEAA